MSEKSVADVVHWICENGGSHLLFGDFYIVRTHSSCTVMRAQIDMNNTYPDWFAEALGPLMSDARDELVHRNWVDKQVRQSTLFKTDMEMATCVNEHTEDAPRGGFASVRFTKVRHFRKVPQEMLERLPALEGVKSVSLFRMAILAVPV
jgi:hypothetical protein